MTGYMSNNIIGLVLDFIESFSGEVVKKKYTQQALNGDIIGNKIVLQRNGKLQLVKLKKCGKMLVIPHLIVKKMLNVGLDPLHYYEYRCLCELDKEEMNKIVTTPAKNGFYVMKGVANFYIIKWQVNNTADTLYEPKKLKHPYLDSILQLSSGGDKRIIREGIFNHSGFMIISRHAMEDGTVQKGRLRQSAERFKQKLYHFIINKRTSFE